MLMNQVGSLYLAVYIWKDNVLFVVRAFRRCSEQRQDSSDYAHVTPCIHIGNSQRKKKLSWALTPRVCNIDISSSTSSSSSLVGNL